MSFSFRGHFKKRFCEHVSLRDDSSPFHRRVALGWNVLRPKFFLDLGVIRSFLFAVLVLCSSAFDMVDI